MTPAPLVTVINDFYPYNPYPGSHQEARSLRTSSHVAPVAPGVGYFLKINPYSLCWKLLFLSDWALITKQKDPFCLVTIASSTWKSSRKREVGNSWGEISGAWMPTGNLHLSVCQYNNDLVYCLTQEKNKCFFFSILGIRSYWNRARSPNVIKRCLRNCCENKTTIKEVKFPLSPSHALQPPDLFSISFICPRLVWKTYFIEYSKGRKIENHCSISSTLTIFCYKLSG